MSDNPAPGQPNAWLLAALRGKEVWNLGQLRPSDVAALNAGARLRLLTRSRGYWANMGPLKTVWRLNPDIPPREADGNSR